MVDDDAALRQALTLALQELGYQAVVAPTTEEILVRLGETPPDVVIADYRLGGGATGIDTVLSLRAAFGAQIPAVILTGDTDPDSARKILAHEVQIRHKPLKLAALIGCLRELAMARSQPLPS